jgi:hypothetical protein
MMCCVLEGLFWYLVLNFRFKFPCVSPDMLHFLVYFTFVLNFRLLFNSLLGNCFYFMLSLLLRSCLFHLMFIGRLFDMWILFMLN